MADKKPRYVMLMRHQNPNLGKPDGWVVSFNSSQPPPTAEKLKRAAKIQKEIKNLRKRLRELLGGSLQAG